MDDDTRRPTRPLDDSAEPVEEFPWGMFARPLGALLGGVLAVEVGSIISKRMGGGQFVAISIAGVFAGLFVGVPQLYRAYLNRRTLAAERRDVSNAKD